jgi:hypothetical protein
MLQCTEEWLFASVYTTSPGTHSAPSDDPQSREYRGTLLKKERAGRQLLANLQRRHYAVTHRV